MGITPAAGYISPLWAMALGALAALPSYALIVWRARTRLDETLDVLAAHGAAGLTGIVFIGLVAQKSWNGLADGLLYGHAAQLAYQLAAVVAAPAYAFAGTFVILRAIGLCCRCAPPSTRRRSGWTSSSTGRRPTRAARARSSSPPRRR